MRKWIGLIILKPILFLYLIECVIIGNQMGLQLTTTYVIGRQTTVFISSNRIKDILINEGFLSVRKRKFSRNFIKIFLLFLATFDLLFNFTH